jgi:hypothetical protein
MTLSTPPRLGRLPSARAALLAACLAPLLAACGGAAAQVQLPARVAATRSAPPAVTPLTPRQQVVVAFSGYTSAMTAAFDSRSPAQVRQLLTPYLDPATISNAIRAFSQAWGQHEVSYGHAQHHILGVRIHGTAAWVHDCDDTSASGLAYSGTGQVVPGTLGSPDENLVTRLNLVSGHWLIGIQTVEEVPCQA